MSISKLNKDLQKIIADYAERPHILLQTSRGWRLNVSALLFQGYEQEPQLKLYVDRAKIAHPDESAVAQRAVAVVADVLKDVSGYADGRGALLPSSALHPPFLAQISEYLTSDLCEFTRDAMLRKRGDSIILFANSILKTSSTDNIEKAEKIRRWLLKNPLPDDRPVANRLPPINKQLFFLAPEVRHFRGTTHLNLDSNKLSFLPPCIGELTALVVLTLSFNQLAFLPPEIGNLTELRHLGIYQNKLTSLPVEFNKLRKLTECQVGNNPFRSIPYSLRKTGIAAVDESLLELPETAFAPPTCWESFCDTFWNIWASLVSCLKAPLDWFFSPKIS